MKQEVNGNKSWALLALERDQESKEGELQCMSENMSIHQMCKDVYGHHLQQLLYIVSV
jgi:hypothetical protein